MAVLIVSHPSSSANEFMFYSSSANFRVFSTVLTLRNDSLFRLSLGWPPLRLRGPSRSIQPAGETATQTTSIAADRRPRELRPWSGIGEQDLGASGTVSARACCFLLSVSFDRGDGAAFGEEYHEPAPQLEPHLTFYRPRSRRQCAEWVIPRKGFHCHTN